MRTAAAPLVVVLLAAAALLAGCTGSDDESAADRSAADRRTATVDIEIADGRVTPQGGRVEVRVGQPISLHVTSDADEELHVHSDPERTVAIEAGADQEATFTLDTPGQVAVEAHELDVTIVQLVVRP